MWNQFRIQSESGLSIPCLYLSVLFELLNDFLVLLAHFHPFTFSFLIFLVQHLYRSLRLYLNSLISSPFTYRFSFFHSPLDISFSNWSLLHPLLPFFCVYLAVKIKVQEGRYQSSLDTTQWIYITLQTIYILPYVKGGSWGLREVIQKETIPLKPIGFCQEFCLVVCNIV